MGTVLDSNAWYYIYYGDPSDETALQVFDINDTGTGQISVTLFDSNSTTSYEWQILPLDIDATTYALRARYLGNRYYVGDFYAPVSTLPGMDTRLRTERYSSPDVIPTRAQWTINSTGDGTDTEFISNVANGTGWHLDDGGSIAYMRDAADFSTTDVMKWTFSSVSAINDADWSYLTVATTSMSTSSGSTTTTPSTSSISTSISSASASIANANGAASVTPTPSSDSSAQNDISASNAKAPTGAIVGGIVGGIALLLLLVGALGFYLRRRKQAAARHQPTPYTGPNELEGKPIFTSRFGTIIKVKQQRSQSPLREKHPAYRTWEDAVELPSDTATSHSSRLRD